MREEETVERKKAAAEHKRKELEAKVASLRKLLREESKGSKIVKEDGLQALPSSLRASDPKAPAPVATAAAPAAPAAKTSVSGNKEAARTVKVLASGAAKAGSAREDHTSAQALKEALKVANKVLDLEAARKRAREVARDPHFLRRELEQKQAIATLKGARGIISAAEEEHAAGLNLSPGQANAEAFGAFA